MAILPPPYSARKPDPPPLPRSQMNARGRALSSHQRTLSEPTGPRLRHRFTFANLRSTSHPKLARPLFTLIKTENDVISAHSSAATAGQSVAAQLSTWGDQSADDAVHSISDKLGVLLNGIAEMEEEYAQALEEARCVLKAIRNTESSVQPARERKQKIHDEIARLNYKDPTSARIGMLEQELVRAEAECLVAEAQLVNITRAKLKEAYAAQFAAVVERSEKQCILARNGRALLNLLDDTPIIPGEGPVDFEHENTAREIINQTEMELRHYAPNPDTLGAVTSNAHVVAGGVIDGKFAATLAAPPPPAPAVPIILSHPPASSPPPVPAIPKVYAPQTPPPQPPQPPSGGGYGGGKLHVPKTRSTRNTRDRMDYSDCIGPATLDSDSEDDRDSISDSEDADVMPGGFPSSSAGSNDRLNVPGQSVPGFVAPRPAAAGNRDTHPAYRLDRTVSTSSSIYSVATNVGKVFGMRGRASTVKEKEKEKEREREKEIQREREEMVMF